MFKLLTYVIAHDWKERTEIISFSLEFLHTHIFLDFELYDF